MRVVAPALVARLFARLNGIPRRLFTTQINPVKPGKLILNSPINMQISPITLTSNMTKGMVEVKLLSKDLEATSLEKMTSKLNIDFIEDESLNELKVDVAQELSTQPLTLNIVIPHHYCKLLF